MALRRDYSLTKDIDFDANREFYDLSDGYVSVDLPAHVFKKAFDYSIKIYQGACGQDMGIEKIFSATSLYAETDINDEGYTLSKESLLLKQLYIQLRDYEPVLEEENYKLGRKIDAWLAKINPKIMSPEQKLQDIQFIGQVEMMLNRRVFVHESKAFFESMMAGSLTGNYPLENPDSDSPATSIDLPVMTHPPIENDIDKEELSSVPLMQVLYNIAAQDSNVIMNMFHDYENGNVCVRLWKNDNGKYVPCFFSINKLRVYLDKIGDLEQKSIWPGLIEAAVEDLGCEDDKQLLAEAILGPEYPNYDKNYLAGPNNTPKEDNSEIFNDFLHQYIKCFYDVYTSMILTNSLVIEDEAPYVKLMFGVKELIYSLVSCMCKSLDIAADSIALLKKLRADYADSVRENGRLSDPTVKKRLSICETMDELLYLMENDCDYHDDPRRYYELILAKQIARIILTSLNEESSPEAVERKTADVMSDRAFKRKVSKMNIHVLKHSTSKMAASVLAAMEGRPIC